VINFPDVALSISQSPILQSYTTYGEDETRALGAELGRMLGPGAVVALGGELGAGKTVIVRGICETLGCADQVSSPSFTIVNEYSGVVDVAHCDLYRLDSPEELREIGLEELFDGGRIVLVEWAERMLPLLPLPRVEILCSHGRTENERSHRIETITRDSDSILAGAGMAEAPR
jgi:tRNA threonylcarbamoyladenosine biosynthesis protein TsaE